MNLRPRRNRQAIASEISAMTTSQEPTGRRHDQPQIPPQQSGPPPDYAMPHQQYAPAPRNGLGIAALVLGLCGALSGLIPFFFWFALIAGIVGLVLGIVGFARTRKGTATNRTTTLFGTVLSVIAIALGIWGAVTLFQATDKLVNDLNAIPAPTVSAPAAPAAVEAPSSLDDTPPVSTETLPSYGSVPTYEAPSMPTYEALSMPTYEAPTMPTYEAPAPTKATKAAPALPVSRQNAVAKAESYLGFSAFSRKGLIDQLKFEKFSTADATYAVDHVKVDWTEQAAKKAKSYMDMSSFSRGSLIEQLEFEGFTAAQAKHGADSVGL